MFGKYKHTLDPKGRLFVPAKLREELGSAFYVARSLDPCLTVYTEEEWQRIVERSKAAPSSKARGLRTFFANVVRCEPDKQGRFLLPDDLRKYAGIQQEVYFLGQAGRAEIWAAERYEEEEANVSAEELAALMEGAPGPLCRPRDARAFQFCGDRRDPRFPWDSGRERHAVRPRRFIAAARRCFARLFLHGGRPARYAHG